MLGSFMGLVIGCTCAWAHRLNPGEAIHQPSATSLYLEALGGTLHRDPCSLWGVL